jgi:hypothetical protein
VTTQLKAFIALNEERRASEWIVEKEYRDVLYDYNDGIRKARRVYDEKMDAIEKTWQQELQKIK